MVERLFYEFHKIKNISHSIEGSKIIKIYKNSCLSSDIAILFGFRYDSIF